MKYLTLNIFVLLSFISCEVKEKKTTSILEKQKWTSKEVKEDSCEDVSLLKIAGKAFTKNIKSFHIDSIFQFQTSEKVMKPESEISEIEFNCLEMNKLPRRLFYEKEGKRIFDIIDTLKYYEKWYYIYSLHFDKNNNLKFFTTYGWAGDGSRAIKLFTISPTTKKIKDMVYVSNVFDDIGAKTNTKSEFVNDSVFIQNTEESFRGEPTLKESVKFLISNTGEIKLLEHKVLINN